MLAWIIVSAVVLGLCILSGILLIILFCNDIIYDPDVLGIVTGFFAVGSLISLILACCKYPEYNAEYISKVADIVSISRDSEVSGHFTLGCGYIKETQYYFYYYPTDKGIKLGKVDADASYIVETDEYTPSIYKVKEYGTFNEDIYYNVYVPFGTVVTTYTLN